MVYIEKKDKCNKNWFYLENCWPITFSLHSAPYLKITYFIKCAWGGWGIGSPEAGITGSSKLSTVCAGNGIQAFLGADQLIPTTKVLLQSLTSWLPALLLVMFLPVTSRLSQPMLSSSLEKWLLLCCVNKELVVHTRVPISTLSYCVPHHLTPPYSRIVTVWSSGMSLSRRLHVNSGSATLG